MDDKSALRVRVDDDRLTAWLIMPESFDRTMLSAGVCDAALLDSGIELNATTKSLVGKFIGEAITATPGPVQAVIAKGVPPRHGKDGHVEWLIDQNPNQQPTDEPGSSAEPRDSEEPVSFYDRSVYTVVRIGDVLAKVHQPTPGVDGRDVTGKTLAARDGRPVDFKHDESILVAKGDQALAQASGVLDRSGKTICIRDTIEVDKYIDFNTGNIDFDGSVIVHKGVRDCFKVHAEKDIEVRGLIEAAMIRAGRDLRALGGFAGREQGEARVAGNLYAKYLDAVQVHVRGDLCVDREIINCKTAVLGRIASPTGSIIGGETYVAGEVEVAELGAEGLPLTVVHVGALPHLDPLIDQLRAIVDELIHRRQQLLDEQELIQKTSGGRVMASHKERLCELMYEIAEAQSQLDRGEPSLERLREKTESMRRVEMRVHKRLFPNTVLVWDGMRYRVRKEMAGPLRITMDRKRRLQFETGVGGEPVLLARQADLSEAA